jgi:hypothetical protein
MQPDARGRPRESGEGFQIKLLLLRAQRAAIGNREKRNQHVSRRYGIPCCAEPIATGDPTLCQVEDEGHPAKMLAAA